VRSSRDRVIILLAALLLAVVPGAGMAGAAERRQGPVEQLEQVIELTQELVDLTVEALDIYWTGWFLDHGLDEPWVLIQTLAPDQSWTSNCINQDREPVVMNGVTNNAMYCSVDSGEDGSGNRIDGVIILPLYPLARMTIGDMWGRGQIPEGNYSAVAMIAHEFSHHIQDELSIQLRETYPPNPEIELLADCFAGRFLGLWNELEPLADAQIDAILLGWGFIGDFNADQQSHGTPGQRRFALGLGFNGGEDAPEICMDEYWPGVDL
jgi:hypothetical protein